MGRMRLSTAQPPTCFCGLCTLEVGCTIIAILGLMFGFTGFTISCVGDLIGVNVHGNGFLYAMGIGSILEIVANGLLLRQRYVLGELPVLAYLIIKALTLILDVSVAGIFLNELLCVQDCAIINTVTAFTVSGLSTLRWILVYRYYRQLKKRDLEWNTIT